MKPAGLQFDRRGIRQSIGKNSFVKKLFLFLSCNIIKNSNFRSLQQVKGQRGVL